MVDRAASFTFDQWSLEMAEAAEDAGVPAGSLRLSIEDYRRACVHRGVLPRAPSGDVDNCALANGEQAVDCQVCEGKCPDARWLFDRACAVMVPGARRTTESSVLPRAGVNAPTPFAFAHTSDTAEHFTPYDVVGAVNAALGGSIDLDPASCALANEYIEATRYFDLSSDGLKQEWRGTVFLNPPGGLVDEDGRPMYPRTRKREGCSTTGACGLPPGHKHKGVTSSAKFWWLKLLREWCAGRVPAAVFLGFNVEGLCGMQVEVPEGTLVPSDCALSLPAGRLRYLHEGDGGVLVPGDSPPHASYLAYLGPAPGGFREAFAPLGRVLTGHQLFASARPDDAAALAAADPLDLDGVRRPAP